MKLSLGGRPRLSSMGLSNWGVLGAVGRAFLPRSLRRSSSMARLARSHANSSAVLARSTEILLWSAGMSKLNGAGLRTITGVPKMGSR
ncbi:unnamed protein product [Somion occarium]|uniref:Uncharacterized protein n=1 Tax=Somion occarium TaxID=3059160 RepID=A0ABP1DEP6_9APHY